MIATKDRDSVLLHCLNETLPPTAITATLYHPDGTELWSSVVAPPSLRSVSSVSTTTKPGELELITTSSVGGKPGDLARVIDSLGSHWDSILIGSTAILAKVAEFGGVSSTVESVWCPEIRITIPAAYLSETGDNYRLQIETTDADGYDHETNVNFPVSLLALDLTISPRDYMDAYPVAANDLTDIESRADWPRLVREAVSVVERKLAADHRVASMLISSVSLRQAVAAALHLIIGQSAVPENWADDKATWIQSVKSNFGLVMRDCLSSASYDADGSGTASADEKMPSTGHRRLIW